MSPETLDLSDHRDLWIVGLEYKGEMGLSFWEAPSEWRTEYALILGVPAGSHVTSAIPQLREMGATAERLPEPLRKDFGGALRLAADRGAKLVLCYWRPPRGDGGEA